MKEEVMKALEDIRPALQNDGGDVELVDVSEDGKVLVRLLGHCSTCPMRQSTVKYGIETALREKVPAVKEVIAV